MTVPAISAEMTNLTGRWAFIIRSWMKIRQMPRRIGPWFFAGMGLCMWRIPLRAGAFLRSTGCRWRPYWRMKIIKWRCKTQLLGSGSYTKRKQEQLTRYKKVFWRFPRTKSRLMFLSAIRRRMRPGAGRRIPYLLMIFIMNWQRKATGYFFQESRWKIKSVLPMSRIFLRPCILQK